MNDLTRTTLVRRVTALEEALARLEAEKAELERAAYQDPLTGLANRRCLEQRSRARGGFYVLADLDGFKAAQDAHPRKHDYGDEILVEFAEFLLSQTRNLPGREKDRVAARVGGDEFVIWCSSRKGSERIKRVIRRWRSRDDAVGASSGVGPDMETADLELYYNKQVRRTT